jgi:hypothetical protein
MKVEAWIHFDEPGEKEELHKIMKESKNEIEANMKLQERFDLNLMDASTVIETYKKRIKK